METWNWIPIDRITPWEPLAEEPRVLEIIPLVRMMTEMNVWPAQTPAVVIPWDAGRYWLIDGAKRMAAAKLHKWTHIPVQILEPTGDLLEFGLTLAVGCNIRDLPETKDRVWLGNERKVYTGYSLLRRRGLSHVEIASRTLLDGRVLAALIAMMSYMAPVQQSAISSSELEQLVADLAPLFHSDGSEHMEGGMHDVWAIVRDYGPENASRVVAALLGGRPLPEDLVLSDIALEDEDDVLNSRWLFNLEQDLMRTRNSDALLMVRDALREHLDWCERKLAWEGQFTDADSGAYPSLEDFIRSGR